MTLLKYLTSLLLVYVARATTPGASPVPPAKAEELYQPETFGRGKTDRVISTSGGGN